MPMEKKKKLSEMTDDEKKARLAEIAFNKFWGNFMKTRRNVKDLPANFGKAPKCNTKVKTPKVVEMANQKKKKK